MLKVADGTCEYDSVEAHCYIGVISSELILRMGIQANSINNNLLEFNQRQRACTQLMRAYVGERSCSWLLLFEVPTYMLIKINSLVRSM